MEIEHSELAIELNSPLAIKPRLKYFSQRHFIGLSKPSSFNRDKTAGMIQMLKSKRGLVHKQLVNNDINIVQRFQKECLNDGNVYFETETWVLYEVHDLSSLPIGFQLYSLDSGYYLIFDFVPIYPNIYKFLRRIIQVWLPNSGYLIDERPYLLKLKDKSAGNSDKELWIPIRY